MALGLLEYTTQFISIKFAENLKNCGQPVSALGLSAGQTYFQSYF